eukprot:TRINITY_DN1687_c0_g1_i2.p2 TRINITY_DN1687_c0_g1~~TRINITY_DN1687_c0_g1_i2.p2  ORF type:complete len:114 (+),score=36.34 TRINITY_DN1687_c0_g1_i2:826-1167(+)
MSSFEQRIEAADKNFQYILFAAEPYETVAFKIPNKEIEKNVGPQIPGESKFWTRWDDETKVFSLQLHFKPQPKKQVTSTTTPAPPPPRPFDPMQPKPSPPANNPYMNYAYFNK